MYGSNPPLESYLFWLCVWIRATSHRPWLIQTHIRGLFEILSYFEIPALKWFHAVLAQIWQWSMKLSHSMLKKRERVNKKRRKRRMRRKNNSLFFNLKMLYRLCSPNGKIHWGSISSLFYLSMSYFVTWHWTHSINAVFSAWFPSCEWRIIF